ncbi:MAG: formate dehydrogenase [Clostridiales bacterium]|nr:formate dehydrogenase [Clostridiales bacterium]
MNAEEIREMIEYYRAQGAPQDQQMLIALLREAQEAAGGVLAQGMLDEIAQAYGMKSTMLQAIIRRVPSLRCEAVPHRLEVCGTCKAGAQLRDVIERTYDVRSRSCNEALGFSYWVVPCMKNCKNGPSIRWDGQIYGQADMELVRQLVERIKRKTE